MPPLVAFARLHLMQDLKQDFSNSPWLSNEWVSLQPFPCSTPVALPPCVPQPHAAPASPSCCPGAAGRHRAMQWGGRLVLAAGSEWDAWGDPALTRGTSVWAAGCSEGAWRHPAGCKLGCVTARTSLLLACECKVR